MSTNQRKRREPAIQVWKDASGEWRFRLRAANGEIQGGGEGYRHRSGAIRGAEAFQRNCALATIQVFDAGVAADLEGFVPL